MDRGKGKVNKLFTKLPSRRDRKLFQARGSVQKLARNSFWTSRDNSADWGWGPEASLPSGFAA